VADTAAPTGYRDDYRLICAVSVASAELQLKAAAAQGWHVHSFQVTPVGNWGMYILLVKEVEDVS
jgi:hypothetical protein